MQGEERARERDEGETDVQAIKRKHAMDKLLLDIHLKREEMIASGLESGFSSSETLQISQELDMLILKYQKHKEQLDKPSSFQTVINLDFLKKLKAQLSKTSIVVVVLSYLHY